MIKFRVCKSYSQNKLEFSVLGFVEGGKIGESRERPRNQGRDITNFANTWCTCPGIMLRPEKVNTIHKF